MPDFRTPGMADSPATFARRAALFAAAVVLVAAAAIGVDQMLPEDDMTLTMRTDSVAGGVNSGTPVVLNGSQVGRVDKVALVSGNEKRVVLSITKSKVPDKSILTSSLGVRYAPWNMFGISSVILQTGSGGTRLTDRSTFYPDRPDDATLTTLLRTLTDLDNEVFKPRMSDIIRQANAVTVGIMPVLGVAGTILQNVVDTQRISTAETLPKYAQMVSQVGGLIGPVLSAVRGFTEWQAPLEPGFTESMTAAMSEANGDFVKQLVTVFGSQGLAQLVPATPIITELMNRVRSTVPDARRNGLELQELIRRIRAAMPTGPDGPVLNLDVVIKGMPALAAVPGLSQAAAEAGR